MQNNKDTIPVSLFLCSFYFSMKKIFFLVYNFCCLFMGLILVIPFLSTVVLIFVYGFAALVNFMFALAMVVQCILGAIYLRQLQRMDVAPNPSLRIWLKANTIFVGIYTLVVCAYFSYAIFWTDTFMQPPIELPKEMSPSLFSGAVFAVFVFFCVYLLFVLASWVLFYISPAFQQPKIKSTEEYLSE